MNKKTVNILGIRGVPAAHGGFETFAAQLAPYLRDKGWAVNVYCQIEPDSDGALADDFEDDWNGICRIHFGSKATSSKGTVVFDWRCVRDAMRRPGVNLVLGYNTAIFSLLLRASGKRVVMNMDGVEWKRAKWSLPVKSWFYLNEFVGSHVANVPVADHPEIAQHLRRHGCYRAEVIPYGAERVDAAEPDAITAMGLTPGGYLVSIARIEPENSILEIVSAFSRQKRGLKLVVLGNFKADNAYHQAVQAAASADVMFPGAIYEKETVAALRFHALAYMHGHQVGGTNPSLVEALAAQNAVIAHDNRFNRWVAGEGQFYFSDEDQLAGIVERLDRGELDIVSSKARAAERHAAQFTLDDIHGQYEAVLNRMVRQAGPVSA
ncbi:DUF1972 domain-containing protein [Devosia sp.]|uniref:DUF1972 domain-containing protein n=1 Tax=Devosia sp. TaxID=1871048 RepID=UPI002FC8554F